MGWNGGKTRSRSKDQKAADEDEARIKLIEYSHGSSDFYRAEKGLVKKRPDEISPGLWGVDLPSPPDQVAVRVESGNVNSRFPAHYGLATLKNDLGAGPEYSDSGIMTVVSVAAAVPLTSMILVHPERVVLCWI